MCSKPFRTIEFRALVRTTPPEKPYWVYYGISEKQLHLTFIAEDLQATGQYDAKGNHIYEGDYLAAYDKNWKVIFSEGCFMAVGYRRRVSLRNIHCEIIGNVYQNEDIRINTL